MFARSVSTLLLVAALPLTGCEMLTGGDKGKDGESIGYACRVSDKLPEDCMKENSTYTPTSILTGWKHAESDLKEKKAGGDTPKAEGEAKTEGETKPEGEHPAKAEAPAAEHPAKH